MEGDGYTNHCPRCLWSKHVDSNPGDRAETCGGLMEPVDVEQKNGEYRVVQQCVQCKFVRKNKITAQDSQEAVLHILRKS